MGTTIGGTGSPKLTDINIDGVSGETSVSSPQPEKSKTESQTEATQPKSSNQHGSDSKQQVGARGSYVQQQLEKAYQNAGPKAPAPNEYVPKNGMPAQEPQNPATTFERSKSAVGDAGRISGKVEYQKLPEDLKSKMNQDVWHSLDDNQRNTVVETYRRFKEHGLWDEVKSVDSGKGHGMGHAKVAGKEFEVDGGTASVKFTAKDGDALEKKLIATKHFGLDGEKFMGREHKGQKSNRESGAPDGTSMHVSIGKNNKFDVHIDKNSPVKEPEHGKTQLDLVGGKKHFEKELLPSKINNKLRTKGIVIEGTIDENRKAPHGAEAKIGVKVELRGPVKKKNPLPESKPGVPNAAPDKMMENISKDVDKAHLHFPTPIGMNPDDVPDAQAVASKMAAEMLDAARKGKTTIQMKIPEFKNERGETIKVDQAKMLKYMEEVGKIVRSEMVAADPELNSVVGLEVTYGDKNKLGTVPLR